MIVLCVLLMVVAMAMVPTVAMAQGSGAGTAASGTSSLTVIWDFLNSAFGISCVAVAVIWLLNKLYSRQPLWKQYEGDVIAAVRYAEKVTEGGQPASAEAKLNAALQYVVKVVEQVEQRRLTTAETTDLKQGIQMTHNSLDASGVLLPDAPQAAGGATQ
jgi:type II secretory pathway component PulF